MVSRLAEAEAAVFGGLPPPPFVGAPADPGPVQGPSFLDPHRDVAGGEGHLQGVGPVQIGKDEVQGVGGGVDVALPELPTQEVTELPAHHQGMKQRQLVDRPSGMDVPAPVASPGQAVQPRSSFTPVLHRGVKLWDPDMGLPPKMKNRSPLP